MRTSFGLDCDPQRVLRFSGIVRVPSAEAAIEDHRPRLGRRFWKGPERVAARGERVAIDRHILTERDRRDRVGAGMPDTSPVNESAEQLTPARDGTIVGDGDFGALDVLSHRAVLAAGILKE